LKFDFNLLKASFIVLKSSLILGLVKRRKVSYFHRSATTFLPCCIPALGRFKGSYSWKTYLSRCKGTKIFFIRI